MAAYNTDYQKVYTKVESSYGAGTGDFSGATGQRVWTTEPVDLSGVKQQMDDINYTVGSATENGPAPVETFQETAFNVSVNFPGATRSSGVTEDNFSKFAEAQIGTAYRAGADETTDAGCSETSIIVTGATAYTARKSAVMIDGEVRLVDTFNAGAKTLTLVTPLSAAPSAGVTVYDIETFLNSEDTDSSAWGFEHDDPNNDVVAKGCKCATIDAVSLLNSETATLKFNIMGQGYERGAGKVTVESTNEITTDAVTPSGGGGVFLRDSAGVTLHNPCAKQADMTSGMENSPVACFGADNGIGGMEKVRSDGGATLKLTVFEDATPMFSEFTDLVGVESEVICQLGYVAGKVVGFIMPKGYIGTADGYPAYISDEKKEYFEVTFKGTPAIFFRG